MERPPHVGPILSIAFYHVLVPAPYARPLSQGHYTSCSQVVWGVYSRVGTCADRCLAYSCSRYRPPHVYVPFMQGSFASDPGGRGLVFSGRGRFPHRPAWTGGWVFVGRNTGVARHRPMTRLRLYRLSGLSARCHIPFGGGFQTRQQTVSP